MARKKHKKTHRRRKSHGMGAIGKMGISSDLGVMVGGIAGAFLNKVIPASVNPKLSAGIKIVAGGILNRTIKNPAGKGIGYGMQAIGAVELLQQFGVLNGIGAPRDTDMMAVSLEGTDEEMNGTESVLAGETDVLAGPSDISVINGEGDLSVMNGEEFFGGSYVDTLD